MLYFKDFMGEVFTLSQPAEMVVCGTVVKTLPAGTKVFFEGKTSMGYSYSC